MYDKSAADPFLAHYGVKGMKWGVRKDRDGGVGGGSSSRQERKAAKAQAKSEAQSTKREAKAKKFEEKAELLRKQKAELEVELANTPKIRMIAQGNLKTAIKDTDAMIKTAEKDVAAAREGRMTSGQKKLAVGAAVVGTAILAYGSYKMAQSGEFNRMSKKGRIILGKETSLFKKKDDFANKDYSAEDIMEKVIPGINPNYGIWGTNMNCRRATFAYEMRRRGYDVRATRTSNASGQNAVGLLNAISPGEKERSTSLFGVLNLAKNLADEDGNGSGIMKFPAGGKNVIKTITTNSIFEELEKQPDGARGEFAAMWRSAVPGIPGGGHSMAYEIIKGKAHIFDAQTGEEYKAGHQIFGNIAQAGYTRLDNVDLNMNYLAKWVN